MPFFVIDKFSDSHHSQRNDRQLLLAASAKFKHKDKIMIEPGTILYDNGRPVKFTPELLARFWSHVAKGDGCWLWLLRGDADGYGAFSVVHERPCSRAHRIAWMIHFGAIPDGLCVLHKCDNPPCVRPDHLFVGTNADNMRDMAKKGRCRPGSHLYPERMPRGEDNFKSKMTTAKVIEMRSLYNGQRGCYARLGRKFHISAVAASLIIRRKFWRHI